MSDVKKLLRDEAEHAEQNKDAAPTSDTKVTRPGRERAKALSVRLNVEEYEQLAAQAEVAGVGSSTLARSMNPADARFRRGCAADEGMDGLGHRAARPA